MNLKAKLADAGATESDGTLAQDLSSLYAALPFAVSIVRENPGTFFVLGLAFGAASFVPGVNAVVVPLSLLAILPLAKGKTAQQGSTAVDGGAVLRVLWTNLVLGMLAGLGTIGLFLPLALAHSAGVSQGVLTVLGVLAILVAVSAILGGIVLTTFAPQVAADEGVSGWAAIRRSVALVQQDVVGVLKDYCLLASMVVPVRIALAMVAAVVWVPVAALTADTGAAPVVQVAAQFSASVGTGVVSSAMLVAWTLVYLGRRQQLDS